MWSLSFCHPKSQMQTCVWRIYNNINVNTSSSKMWGPLHSAQSLQDLCPHWHILPLFCNPPWQFVVFSCEIEVRSSQTIKLKSQYQSRWQFYTMKNIACGPQVGSSCLVPVSSLISSSDTSFHYLQWGITSSHCGGSRWGRKRISSFSSVVFKSCDLMGPKSKHIKLPLCRSQSLICNPTPSCNKVLIHTGEVRYA